MRPDTAIDDAPGCFLERSNQLWKLRAHEYIFFLAGGVWLLTLTGTLGTTASLSGLRTLAGAIALASGVWAAASIRCPSCRTRLYWMALLGQPGDVYRHWLTTLEICPVCGSNGSTSVESRTPESRPRVAPKNAVLAAGLGLIASLATVLLAAFLLATTYRFVGGDSESPDGIEGFRPHNLLFGLVSWTAGSWVGGVLARRLTPARRVWPVVALGGLLVLVNGLLNIGPFPGWFKLANFLACVVPLALGFRFSAQLDHTQHEIGMK